MRGRYYGRRYVRDTRIFPGYCSKDKNTLFDCRETEGRSFCAPKERRALTFALAGRMCQGFDDDIETGFTVERSRNQCT